MAGVATDDGERLGADTRAYYLRLQLDERITPLRDETEEELIRPPTAVEEQRLIVDRSRSEIAADQVTATTSLRNTVAVVGTGIIIVLLLIAF